MPTWLKVVLIILSLLIVLVGAAGFLVVRAFESGQKAADRARVEGKVLGEYGSLDDCVEDAVRRTGACDSNAVQCIFVINGFLWACLEAAPYDAGFCAGVPAAGDDAATQEWGAGACTRYGMPNDEQCRFNLSVVPAFCTSR